MVRHASANMTGSDYVNDGEENNDLYCIMIFLPLVHSESDS